MKELTIEEKAKAYDNVVEVLKKRFAKEEVCGLDKSFLQKLFPELKESEDEKIRKAIIEIVKKDEERIGVNAHLKKIQWLEKQAEHAKFCDSIQVGDKVTRNQDGVLVNLSQLERVAKPAEKYNITGIGSKHAEGKLGEMIKNIKFVNEVLEQKPAEWSEEDEKMLKACTELVGSTICVSYGEEDGVTIDSCRNWLKSLRPQNWTKEDKERYISCLQRLSTGNPEQSETINSKWFKEHVYPQATWKPSDEQMHYLHWIANVKLGDSVVEQEVSKHLNELYEDLKKLREE